MRFLISSVAILLTAAPGLPGAALFEVVALDHLSEFGMFQSFGSSRDTIIFREFNSGVPNPDSTDVLREVTIGGQTLWKTPPPDAFASAFAGLSSPNLGGFVPVTAGPGRVTPGVTNFTPYVYSPTTGYRALGLPDAPGATTEGVQVWGINDAGQVVGEIEDFGVALRYSEGGGWEQLPPLQSGGDSSASGLNNRGDVVGWSEIGRDYDGDRIDAPFFYSGATGTIQPYDAIGNPYTGFATAVNDSGLVTGSFGGQFGVWDTATGEVEILKPEGGGTGTSINEVGSLVGHFAPSGDGIGFAWTEEDGFFYLEERLTEDFWRITRAEHINDFGDILGTAQNTRSGELFQVMLRPVPEPSAAVLAMLGLTLAALARRRRS